jgi:hypothetical protein
MTRSMYRRYKKIPFWDSSDWFKYIEYQLRRVDESFKK